MFTSTRCIEPLSIPLLCLLLFCVLGAVPDLHGQQPGTENQEFDAYRVLIETLWFDANPSGTFRSMQETLDVGCDVGEPVSPDYDQGGNEFGGKVNWVQIDTDDASKEDHMIGMEERFHFALARQ